LRLPKPWLSLVSLDDSRARLKPAADDLENRRPVWDALSTLFLDTDTSLSHSWRVKVLSESVYSLEEIERILFDEVYPVCAPNLRSVAGEWAGFDSEWLETKILKHRRRWSRRFGLGRLLFSKEWRPTKADVYSRERPFLRRYAAIIPSTECQ
jgi:hypothetical protein